MKILCCGDRHWTNKERIREILISYPPDTVVIEGEASGADKLCKEVAKSLGMTVIPVPADWNKYGRAAGPIRNKLMLDIKPEIVIAFHNNIQSSKGTKNCLMQARQRGIRTLVLTEKEEVNK